MLCSRPESQIVSPVSPIKSQGLLDFDMYPWRHNRGLPRHPFLDHSLPLSKMDLDERMKYMEQQFLQLHKWMDSVWRDFGLEMDNEVRNFHKNRWGLNSSQNHINLNYSPLTPLAFNDSMRPEIVESEEGRGRIYRLKIHVGENFPPESITVKVSLKNRVLTIEAKTENKTEVSEDGYVHNSSTSRVYREVKKQFTLPQDLDLTEITSIMGPDGVLTVEAPLPEPKPKPQREHAVEIPVEVNPAKITEIPINLE